MNEAPPVIPVAFCHISTVNYKVESLDFTIADSCGIMPAEKEGGLIMDFIASVLRILDTSMTVPTAYGWFHLLWIGITVAAAFLLCKFHPNPRKTLLVVTLTVIFLEIYKQVNYTFSYEGGIEADYQWYAFPFQFCSTPMYVGLLAALTKPGKFHDALCAYLATFAVFAGGAVMALPGDVFISTVGINVQTMICHGSMVFIGIYLLQSGYVKLEHKTILKAAPVFAVCVGMALLMNEVAYRTGLLETETFNMFFISPYCDPHLPVYSLVQGVVPFPWCVLLYILGFTAAAYIVLLAAMGIACIARKITHKTDVVCAQ